MIQLERGGNAPLPPGRLSVVVCWSAVAGGASPDVSAYVIGRDGKVSGDRDMVFFGQRRSGDGAVTLEDDADAVGASAGGAETVFAVDPAAVRPDAVRIAFAAAFHDASAGSFAGVSGLHAGVRAGGVDVAAFPIPTTAAPERAMILLELYRRDAGWKVRAVGQGFNGGLKPLSEHFGVDVADEGPHAAAPTTPRASPSGIPSIRPATARAPVSLSKITLDKAKPTIDLSKGDRGFGEIRVNLNWNRSGGAPAAKPGFFGRLSAPKGVDLDLGCLFELRDGAKGVVQALGTAFGDYESPPFVKLSGDDRTGAVSDGEWLRVNGRHWADIRRLLVFALIYEGVPNWSATDGVVVVHVPDQPPIEVRLEDAGARHRLCVVALIENADGHMRVSREVRYLRDQAEMDAAYHWGLRWRRGSKD